MRVKLGLRESGKEEHWLDQKTNVRFWFPDQLSFSGENFFCWKNLVNFFDWVHFGDDGAARRWRETNRMPPASERQFWPGHQQIFDWITTKGINIYIYIYIYIYIIILKKSLPSNPISQMAMKSET